MTMDFTSDAVEAALNSLASCIRCRERRVGCDRLLPSCQACAAIGAECELYDHVLDARFPRSYLQALHERLRHLEALEASPAAAAAARTRVFGPHVTDARNHSKPTLAPPAASKRLDAHEDDVYEEWGPSSPFAHLRLITNLLNVELTRPLRHGTNFNVDIPLTVNEAQPSHEPRLPPFETASFLWEFYYNSVETIMPIVGRKLGDEDLQHLYSKSPARKNLRACTRAQLVLAQAARCLFRSAATEGSPAQSQAYLQLSDAMFEAAAANLRIVLNDSTHLLDYVSPSVFENEEAHAMAKLQIVLLLVCYVLMAPLKGNVWQLLGFAERLWRNIQNARAQLRRSNSPDGFLVREQARHKPQPNLLYCSFVSLERIVGMAYGRPIDFLDFAEADEPSHRPEDRTVAAMHASILEIRQRIHSAFLAGQQGPSVMGPLPGTPKLGTVEWYDTIRRQADAWYEDWQDAVDENEESRKEWLLSSGRKWRDETLHLAFCLLIQRSPTPASTPASTATSTSGKSPSQRQLLSLDLVAEGRGIVQRLVHDYAYLLRQPFSIKHKGTYIPLVFPRLWVFDMEIFRVAITAAYLAHHRENITGNTQPCMTWEVANCIKLLSRTSAEVDTEGLTEAILALVEGGT
ncbi:uncharacterized protein K452DRAFT_307691 [Aplosporella prunicola CBS 121167]|uniref:Zn(2)-C6 fungal-type domain-containing protein n=1 Tax=Aplosporella prunicola CBS 121167 TaxID=1176127 RepID=A0A6A6BF25_9PEZI|nr:uncharacterized protein K452DRAFT_307691 [Aplosporella prunicola CBS 121167]KAF2142769.1 hypothetical protein K452DRAFT_307691 [Aplosporella prunicola CBS 121167]